MAMFNITAVVPLAVSSNCAVALLLKTELAPPRVQFAVVAMSQVPLTAPLQINVFVATTKSTEELAVLLLKVTKTFVALCRAQTRSNLRRRWCQYI